MSANGIVEDFGLSSGNKRKIKISGLWYFEGKCDTSDLQKGDHIEFDSKEFVTKTGFKGVDLQSWAKTPKGNGAPAQTFTQAYPDFRGAPTTPQAQPVSFPPELLPSVSNVVAHAITQGLIKSPRELGPWVIAWRLAFERPQSATLKQAPVSDNEPPPYTENDVPFDDKVPF